MAERPPADSRADNWDRVKSHLVASGHMTVEGVTRKVTARTCRTCGAPVLAGLDGDVVAFDVRVDPTPTNVVGEALALLAGRPTFTLKHRSNRYQLDPREPYGIRGQPAGTREYDVLVGHECGTSPLPAIPSVYQPRSTVSHADDKPPF